MGGVSPLSGLEPVLFRQRVHRLTVYTLFEDTSFVFANVVDATTTFSALSNGAVEVNPIITVMAAKVGLLSALAFKVGLSGLAGSVLYLRGRRGLLTVLTVGLVLLSVNNAIIGLLA